MTALTIVVTGTWRGAEAVEGVTITSHAFATVAGWFPYVLAVAVWLFAYSTILSYAYYGMKAFGSLFGDNRVAENAYKVLFLSFTVIGAAATLGPVILFADSLLFLLALCNVLGLYFLATVIRREFSQYWTALHAREFAEILRGALHLRRSGAATRRRTGVDRAVSAPRSAAADVSSASA